MGLFLRDQPPRSEARSGFAPVSFDSVAAQLAAAGLGLPYVTEERALHSAAAWACIDVLCTTVTTLPIDVMRRVGPTVAAAPAPAVIQQPSPLVSRRVWTYQLMFSLTTDGNAFGWVGDQLDSFGNPTRIDLLHPSAVTNRTVDDNGIGTVTVKGKGPQKLWPHGSVWHVPGKVIPAGQPYALSPLHYGGTSIGAGLEAEEYGARFFTEGGHPSALLRSDQELDEPMAQRIKRSFLAAIRPGSREPLVMGSGLEYEQIQSPPGETQFLELLRFSIEQACRRWRVPPAMVYAGISGQNITYQNVSQADLHYLKHSVDGYLTNFEEAMSAIIVRPRFVQVNRDALLRADPETRGKVQERDLKNRTRTVNEVRDDEGRPRFDDPEFDKPGVPPWPGATSPPALPPAGDEPDDDEPEEGA